MRNFLVSRGFDSFDVGGLSRLAARQSIPADTEPCMQEVINNLDAKVELARKYQRLINDAPSKFTQQGLISWAHEKQLVEEVANDRDFTDAEFRKRRKYNSKKVRQAAGQS